MSGEEEEVSVSGKEEEVRCEWGGGGGECVSGEEEEV